MEDDLCLCVRLEKPGSYAWCVIRAAIACQKQLNLCLCPRLWLYVGGRPRSSTIHPHSHGSSLKYEKSKLYRYKYKYIYIQN